MDIDSKLLSLKKRAIREKHGIDIEDTSQVFDKINEIDNQVEELKNRGKKSMYRCGGLLLDFDRAILQYKDNDPVPITPQNKEIILLRTLMERVGRLVEYLDIYTELYPEAHFGKDSPREIQLKKKYLVKLLKKTGMTSKDINDMIQTLTKSGYKLICK